ncbi:hypothetical protein CPA40_08020 [Bifidobacterium callitrichos]|uniref:Uncharacterized protein n=1 Tax=Bifidobacterium callitrichos TaxID=762209 RepID=A0A2T3G955_9BIFI|nr:hypothetical protein [Bifidobacterium callitrichos]PST46014.1 hypothetical protein CPA40_08020 [Bifidobacterium callitrichos]
MASTYERRPRGDGFIGYEYTSRAVDERHESMVADAYRNFGWIPDGSRNGRLNFKRDRTLTNRTELVRLQRQFDSHMRELESLEQAPRRKATMVGLTMGFAGCVLLGGATFAYLGGLLVLMIALAIPGFACWIGAYPLSLVTQRNETERNEPVIDHLYDVSIEVCRKANALLNR